MNMTLQGKKRGEQPSNMVIREKLRVYALEAVERLVHLMHSTNDNVALGATKEVVSKFIPNLKGIEVSSKDGKSIPFTVIIQSKIK